ncbi:VanZ family protein [Bradyrhizobium sp. S3.12.5]|uniref:VanZ family protein n=1 Tax=Bradyrhizobium sp. S3.12.5 TaxID=3156386 RepID=UPI0033933DE2
MIAGWLALAFIAFATLAPIQDRPMVANLHLEHFAAFAAMGLAFAVGSPRRPIVIAATMVASAVVLESLQLLTADRHGRIVDAFVKATGGVCGVGIGQVIASWLSRIEIRLALPAKSRH